jgi:hypothetical protein
MADEVLRNIVMKYLKLMKKMRNDNVNGESGVKAQLMIIKRNILKILKRRNGVAKVA